MQAFIRQLSQAEAIKFAANRKWESMTPAERGAFQLYQECLCMPMSIFHEGLEAALGRGVWSHELAFPELLQRELEGMRGAPTLEEIIALVPIEKVITVKNPDP